MVQPAITADSLLQLAQDPPKDSRERFALYEAARKLMLSVEDPMSVGSRVHFNVGYFLLSSGFQRTR
jgi:demethylsterigmatocystin 6-O-methyltransferase